MGLPKLSMMAIYRNYFRISIGTRMRGALYFATAFVCACYIAIFWEDTFFCGRDVSIQWSQEEGACNVFYAPEPFIVNFTLNLTCYLIGTSDFYMTVHMSLQRANRCIFSVYSAGYSSHPRCFETINWRDRYLCAWYPDHLHHHRSFCDTQDRHRAGESCL